MKFTIDKQTFHKHLIRVNECVDSSKVKSSLSNIVLRVEDSELHMSGSSSDLSIRTKVAAVEKETAGSVAVNSQKLLDIVAPIRDQSVNVVLEKSGDKQKLRIKTSSGLFQLATSDPSHIEFPTFYEETDDSGNFEIERDMLLWLLQKTEQFTAPKTEWRPFLIGVYLDVVGNNVNAVATDSHRMAVAKSTLAAPATKDTAAILPKMCITPVMNLLSSLENSDKKKPLTVQVKIRDTSIELQTEEFVLNSSVVSGRYPNYKEVLPTEDPDEFISVDTSREELRYKLKNLQPIAGPAGSVMFTFSDSTTKIASTNQDGEEGEDSLNSTSSSAEPPTNVISFNISYVIQTLDKLDSNEVEFRVFPQPGSSTEFRNPGQGDLRYIVMPLNT